MTNFSKSFQAFWADEHGATAIEYGLIAALIAAPGQARPLAHRGGRGMPLPDGLVSR